MSDDTAPCSKCREAIATDASRCPECGYEPSRSGRVAGGLAAIVCFPAFIFSVLLVFVSAVLPFSGTDLSTAVVGIVIFGIGATISGAVLFGLYKKEDTTPTDPSLTS